MRFDIPAYWLANVTSIPRRSPGHGWKLDENETNSETYGNHASKNRYRIVNIMQGFFGSKLKKYSLTCESGIFIPTFEVHYQMSRLWWAMLRGKESGRGEGGADADFVSSIIIGKIHASRKWKGNFKSFFREIMRFSRVERRQLWVTFTSGGKSHLKLVHTFTNQARLSVKFTCHM